MLRDKTCEKGKEMAAHNEYETKKGKGCIGIQYMYHIDKKGKEIVTLPPY